VALILLGVFFPPSSPRWPKKKITTRGKRAFKRDARREKRAQAAAGVRKAGIGEDFSNLRGVAIGKKRWGMGNSRIHVHIMCICIYL